MKVMHVVVVIQYDDTKTDEKQIEGMIRDALDYDPIKSAYVNGQKVF